MRKRKQPPPQTLRSVLQEWIALDLVFVVVMNNGDHLNIIGRDTMLDGDVLLTESDGAGGTTCIPIDSISHTLFTVVDELDKQHHHPSTEVPA